MSMNSTTSIFRKRSVGPFRVVEKYYQPGSILPKHEHPTEFVSFLLTGGYDEISRKERRTCAAGTVIWHPRTEAHADQFYARGGLLLDLEIDAGWLDEASRSLRLAPRARMYRGGLAYSLGLRLYRALADPASGVEDIAVELLSCFFGGMLDRGKPEWFQRAMEMAAEIDDPGLSLTCVARETGVHPVHLARSFRRFSGCTFSDYVSKLRVRRALQLLLVPNHTIADVAFACGFADQAHLSRTFKKTIGLTPLVYRRQFCARRTPRN